MLAGMMDLMPSSMALLAPNVNSYRRFQPGMTCRRRRRRGHNNRTVALRIPCGDRHNHRVEYRVAVPMQPISGDGSDFCRYFDGLDNELPLQEEVEGNGLEQEGHPSRFARAMPGEVIET